MTHSGTGHLRLDHLATGPDRGRPGATVDTDRLRAAAFSSSVANRASDQAADRARPRRKICEHYDQS